VAQVVIEMSGKEAALVRSLQKVVQAQVAAELGFKKVGHASDSAHNKTQEGAKKTHHQMTGLHGMIMQVGAAFGAWKLAEGVFSTLTSLAREAQQEVKEIAKGMEESYEGAKRLWQLAENQEAWATLSEQQKMAMRKGGIPRQQAGELVFSLYSFQQLEALPQVIEAAKFMKPEVAAEYISRLRAPTAWGKDIATPEQGLAGLTRGALRSGFDINVTADWFAETAAAFSRMGATPWEVLGVGAATSTAFPSGELQSTAMRRLEATLGQWRERALYEGTIKPEQVQGLIGTFKAFKELAPEEYMEAMLSNVRYKAIASALEKPETLLLAEKLSEEIKQAFETGADYWQKVGDRPRPLERIHQLETARRAKELAIGPLAEQQIELETAIELLKAIYPATGKPLTIAKGWEKGLETGAMLGGVKGMTKHAYQKLIDTMAQEFPEIFKREIFPAFGPKMIQESIGAPMGAPGAMAIGHITLHPFLREIPKEMSDEQREAIFRAVDSMTEQMLGERSMLSPGQFRNVQQNLPPGPREEVPPPPPPPPEAPRRTWGQFFGEGLGAAFPSDYAPLAGAPRVGHQRAGSEPPLMTVTWCW